MRRAFSRRSGRRSARARLCAQSTPEKIALPQTDNKSYRKHVTWFPVVSMNTKTATLQKQGTTPCAKSVITLHPPGEKLPNRVKGVLTAHSRGDTHSVLLTISHDRRHRAMQLLIDLCEQYVRRIYDGSVSWNVSRDGPSKFYMNCKLNTIVWLDDGQHRDAFARGFRLDWLNGEQLFSVTMDKRTGRVARRSYSRDRRARASYISQSRTRSQTHTG